jgi:hypothetical protein
MGSNEKCSIFALDLKTGYEYFCHKILNLMLKRLSLSLKNKFPKNKGGQLIFPLVPTLRFFSTGIFLRG